MDGTLHKESLAHVAHIYTLRGLRPKNSGPPKVMTCAKCALYANVENLGHLGRLFLHLRALIQRIVRLPACAIDAIERLYINSAAISADLRRKAKRDRVTVFVKIPECIVGLVPVCWAIASTDGRHQGPCPLR